jgi:hypothetical protein
MSPPTAADIDALAKHCRRSLDLAGAKLPDEYFYDSLSLCVIDAVYSIGVRYESVTNVVARYRQFAGLNAVRRRDYADEPESLRDLVSRIEEIGVAPFAENILRNRQRTAPTSGILKAEAVLRFSRVLIEHEVVFLKDLQAADIRTIEEESLRIPGQGSGIAFKYFLMLAGNDNFIKPDRMIQRFLSSALNRTVEIAECQELVAGTVAILRETHSHITPRSLDYLIWNFQRDQGRKR